MNRFFGHLWGQGDVKPQLIAKKIKRLMDASQTESLFKIFVPARYRVLLSKTDLQRLKALQPTVVTELVESIKLYADRQGYCLSCQPEIVLEAKTDLDERLQVHVISEISTDQTKVFARPKTKAKKTNFIFELEILTGSKRGKVFQFSSQSITLGRREDNQVLLDDADVSRYHARINYNKHWQIVDLNSTNGVFVNGKRIKSARLNSEDEILLGSTMLKFWLK